MKDAMSEHKTMGSLARKRKNGSNRTEELEKSLFKVEGNKRV